MELADFNKVSVRLKSHFGVQNFSEEKLKLIWTEVRDLSAKDFSRMIDTGIGEFNVEYPPKVSAFREWATEQRKANKARETQIAAQKYKSHVENQVPNLGLQKILKEMGVKDLNEAIKKRKAGA